MIAYKSASSESGDAVTSLDVARPNPLTTRDVIVAAVARTVGTGRLVPPPGFTAAVSEAAEGIFLDIFVRVAGPSEPPTYPFAFGVSEHATVALVVYSGVHPTIPILAQNAWVSGYTKKHATLSAKKGVQAEAMAVSAFALAAAHPISPATADEARDPEFPAKTAIDSPRNPYEQAHDLLLDSYKRGGGTPYVKRVETNVETAPRTLQVSDQRRSASGSTLYTEATPFAGDRAKAAIELTANCWGVAAILLLRPAGGIQFVSSSHASGSGVLAIAPTPPGISPGQTMVASIMVDATEDLVPGMPEGWRVVGKVFNENNGRTTWTFSRVAAADEPVEHVWRLSGETYP